MAAELATGYVSLSVSTRGMGKEIARGFQGADRAADVAGKKAGGRFSGAMGGALKAGMIGAGVLAGAAAIKGLGSVIGAASGAQQALGGVGAVFGNNAKEIEGASKRAAKAAGLSTTAYQELATALGAGLKNQGVKGFTGATENLIGIGADLAAQFGGSSKEAVEALASAMRGESDPIERYGVSLNESAVNAELARKGQAKLTGQALITAKAEARLALITKQTGDAFGAFARENDTLAGKQQIAGAQWDNLKAKIGGVFLPVASKAMGFVSDKMIPGLSKLTGILSASLGPAFAKAKAFIAPLVGAVKGLFAGIKSGEGSAGFIKTQLVPALMGIVGAGQRLAAVVLPIIKQIAAEFVRSWPQIKAVVGPIFNTVKGTVLDVMGIITQVIRIATALIKTLWEKNGAGIIRSVKGVFGGIAKIIGGAMKIIGGIVKLVLAVITGDKKKAMKAWKQIWSGIKSVIVGIWKVLKNTVVALLRTLLSEILKKWKGLLTWLSSSFKAGLKKVTNYILDPVRTARDKIKEIMAQIGRRFTSGVNVISKAWNALKEKAKEPIRFIVNTVINDGLLAAFNEIAGKVGAKTIARVSLPKGFATGGILPGYTPGRDVHQFFSPTGGRLDLSGGEPVMRPEFGRAVGKGWVDKANQVARTRGVGGVRSFLNGSRQFAQGGMIGKFAPGGIIGKVKDKVSRVSKTVKNFIVTTITKLVAMGGALKNSLGKVNLGKGGGAFGNLGRAAAGNLKDALFNKGKDWVQRIVTTVRKKIPAGGGPIGKGGYARALSYARAHEGHPYIFGSMWDCSGFISALHNIIRGGGPGGRRYSTPAFHGAHAQGFTRGKRSPFMIGVNPAPGRFGHMAGTLNGVNVESAGGAGVRVGGNARGWNSPMFSWRGGLASGGIIPRIRRKPGDLPYDLLDPRGERFNPELLALFKRTFDSGGYLKPGLTIANNQTGVREKVLDPAQTRAWENGQNGGVHFNGPVTVADPRALIKEIDRRERRRMTLQPSMI